MGDYSIDFTKATIIVDGHICDKTEYEGIYKVRDEYLVNWKNWSHNEANKNLTIISLPTENENKDIVKYVCNRNSSSLNSFINMLRIEDESYMELECIHYDSSLMFMGGTWL